MVTKLLKNNASTQIGLHYFNPVQLMGLVEVIRTDRTDPAVFQAALDFVKQVSYSLVLLS